MKKGEGMVTQKDIAKRIGMDVSTCNKILHKVKGPKFRRETIELVFRTAREMGWDFDRYSKGWAMAVLREVFPDDLTPQQTATFRRLPLKQVLAVRKVLYKTAK
jgi:predicted transcriptional regulator